MTKSFTTSLWGDSRLFFQHADYRHDVMDKWRNARPRLYIPEFDKVEHGEWPDNDNFRVNPISEEDFIAGLAPGRCPF